MEKLFGLGDVARMLGVQQHKVVYALLCGYVPEPKMWVSGKRAWSMTEIETLAEHFGSKICPEKARDGEALKADE